MPPSKPSSSLPFGRVIRAVKGGWQEITGGERAIRLAPFKSEFKGYSGSKLFSDARAGLNVALLAFPQGMAYALVAGLPIHYGITCAAIAALLAPFFFGSRHTVLGPTNATAFMVFSFFAAYPALGGLTPVQLMPLVVLLVGLLLVFGAVFRVADLIQYVSRSVIVGYIAGASLLIIANQLRHLLGVDPAAGRSFFTILGGTLAQIPKMQMAPFALGIGTLIVYLIMQRWLRGWPNFAICLLLASMVAALLPSGSGVATFSEIDRSSLLPDLGVFVTPGLLDNIAQLFGLAFGLAFLASLENSVMAKTLASRTGDRPDMNQDMFGIGIANLGCSVCSGMVASGSLTRSALNFSSGAKTRVSSILSALLCVAGLFALAPFIRYVPTSALAALVIGVALTLNSLRQLRTCFAATRSDAVTLVVTFFAALLMPLHVAIFIGVGTAIALFLRKAARPELVEYDLDDGGELNEIPEGCKRSQPAISIVHVEGELFFGAAELFRNQIQATASDPNLKIIVLRMKNARHLDATSVFALEDLVQFLRDNDRELIISGVMKDVYKVLKNAGAVEIIGKENIFPGSIENPNIATRNALKRAQEILGTKDVDVRIFHDPSKAME